MAAPLISVMAGFFSLIMALSILTLNCNGIRDQSKRVGLVQWLRSLPVGADIVCLQETHCLSSSECSSWFLSSGFSAVVSPGSSHSCGCIVLFRPSLSLVNSWCDVSGRYLQVEFSFFGSSFRVCCVYAPNRNPARDQFFGDLHSKIDPSIPTILCGDFNEVFDRSVDRAGSDPSVSPRDSSSSLKYLFDDCCVVDIWRYLHPSSVGFTWTRWDGSLASRIDLFGVPFSWVPSVSSCSFVPCPFSDHCGVFLSCSIPDAVPPGPGFWKLNISVLDDPEYVELISNAWRSWRNSISRFPSLAKWWDGGKSLIKGLTIRYCCRKAGARSRLRDLLVRLIDHLKAKVDLGSSSCLGPYHSALAELAALDSHVAKGAQVRSRVKWVEEGESSSSYFFRLERKRGSDRWISALRDEDDSIVSSPRDLCTSLSSFFSGLFSASPVDPRIQTDLLGNLSSSLPDDQSSLCEGHLSVEEVLVALRGMARRKAPGLDGLPMEFYLKFWSVLGSDLVAVLNSSFDSGCLSLSQRRGVISLSFKKGDRLDPRNWRPITLLNVDYKLASRAIAGRLLKVIHLLVAEDQTCGVPGRYIGENVALLRDVVAFASSSGAPVAILSLDQEKAFDRVDWGFMRSTLVAMGFGPSFVAWVDLFYHRVQSSVNVNGYISGFFDLSRGVRQGCPLSPLLYVLVSEVLAANIRCNTRISGLHIPGFPPLSPISQYADDTSLIVSSDDAIRAVFETYALFERASGSKLNQTKSKGLWLGGWCGRTDPPVALEWSSCKIKVLGVFIGAGDLDVDNWRPRIEAVDHVLKSWRSRCLSFRGKALVINALALSRVWYVASLVHMPAWVAKELSSLAFSFFWSGKRELVSRSVVIQSSLFGGFSVVSVQYKVWALLGQWVRRFASSSAGWSSLMSFWFVSSFGVLPSVVFSSPFCFDPRVLPPFYSSLLLAWRGLNGSFATARNSLVFGSSCPHVCCPVAVMSTKSCYLYLLSENMVPPHCVGKFFPVYGSLDWPSTWRSLTFFDLDRQVTDLCWKIAHGVLYTAQRLVSFGLPVPPSCFCGSPVESLEHLFFFCPLAQSVLSWLQSLLFCFSFMCPALLCRHVLFGFSSDELIVTPRVFVYLLNLCKYFIWQSRNDFRFRAVRPGAAAVIARVKSRLRFHLPIFFKRFQSARRRRFFHRQWGARGVVATVSDGHLSLAL